MAHANARLNPKCRQLLVDRASEPPAADAPPRHEGDDELGDGVAHPAGERAEHGAIAAVLGEVFHYVVRSTDTNRTPTELRTLQDWVVKPELRKVPGVAEVNTWGGFEKQFHVVVETDRLVKYRLTFEDLVE